MKASELMKHLEEGGLIKRESTVLRLIDLPGWDYNPISNPNDWEIVVPKVKYSVDIWLSDRPYKGGKGLEVMQHLFGSDFIHWNPTKMVHLKQYKITVEEL